ncbi:MAG TPA: ATP phosphoribosyltransferase regulatory subunit [Labilithrix sp.]|nr:ATP phosphoribosyltransferase regulatory subunit [Labilithrix sp.]
MLEDVSPDEVTLTALEHPLPPGMRDLLPEETQVRRDLSHAIRQRFSLHGYRLVTPPAFELASVLERGLGASAADDVLRFIEPESGEVAVLRPDMTPQVARIVATRLGDREPPFRLAYEGSVVRRRSSRAKKHRQIPQVGVELCGVAGAEGDLELLCVAADALATGAGLNRFTIDISDAAIVRELLASVPAQRAAEISVALARKDEPSLAELTSGLAEGPLVTALARLHGGREAVVEAARLLARTRAAGPVQRLLALYDSAIARGLGAWLSADPGEVRGLAYYTGTIFSIYAEGPGVPVGAGGRYDDLLARYGAPRPAVGLGIDLDALEWAVRAARAIAPRRDGVVVVGPDDDPRLAELRSRGIAAVAISDPARARAYAASWGFAYVWEDKPERKSTTDEVVRVLDDLRQSAPPGTSPGGLSTGTQGA